MNSAGRNSSVKFLIFPLLLFFFFGNAFAQDEVKYYKRQFRGVWIASVNNLDWPSKPGMTVWRMKWEYRKLLDMIEELGMNAVIVQIRPMSDAFYPSNLEPWSKYLTGKQGKSPPRNFDPLEYMIEETHSREMEFHAWFNPFRALRNLDREKFSENHVFNKNSDWFVTYANNSYFDPGMTPAREFLQSVIADVVSKYDIDAVHLDDYFYPGQIDGMEFPDSLSFRKYGQDYLESQKNDWRRDNVNLLVKNLFDTINSIKPWVHFGISPFGVWRNKENDQNGSDTKTLQTDYDHLYADVLKWCEEGWMDYVMPQNYQFIGRDIMDYEIVAKWWNENHGKVNYYIGQAPYRLGTIDGGEAWSVGNEIDRQLMLNQTVSGLQGSAYFRAKIFKQNPLGINDSLKNKFYKHPAIPPVSFHDRGRTFEANMTIKRVNNRRKVLELEWEAENSDEIMYYVIYSSPDTQDSRNILEITSENSVKIRKNDDFDESSPIYIKAVDKYRIESMAMIFLLQ